MKAPIIPANELERHAALCRLNILDTPDEDRFDRVTRIAQSYFKTDIVLVSIIDSNRQWFKSRQGLDATETPRDISFCGHAILGEDIFYVPNALEDQRFADNPLVTGPPNIRFYAGAPLHTPSGERVGTLCIIHSAPKSLTKEDMRSLRDMADCVEQELAQVNLQETSHALASQKSRLQAVLDTVIDGIITIDDKGVVETFNPAAERLFGYAADEVIGKNVKTLMPKRYSEEHDSYLQNYNESNAAKIIGIGREVIGLRKDGSTFPMELAVGKMAVHGVQKFTGIVRDITERKEVSDSLLKAKEDADKANRAKSEFLSSMSHELRTPLNAILGFGQMLDFNPKEPLSDSQKRCVDQIVKGGDHLLVLINDILDLAKIEAGKVELSIEDIDPNKALEECLTLTMRMATERGLKIIFPEAELYSYVLKVDYTRFKQVLLNLMSNAIKYNCDGGKITVTYKPTTENMLRISISDTGKGIPLNRQDELFKAFSRLDAESSGIEGTGIGLVVCKDLVELMGGSIGCESELGKGSTFWLELPLAFSQSAVMDGQNTSDNANSKGLMEDATGSILYVEDNPSNLQLMEMVVSCVEGLSLSSTHTAELGIKIARSNHFDVIILDINLPGMSGLEAIKEMKKYKTTKGTPILALSAAATKKDIEKGLAAGFERYLTKPINVIEMTGVLREMIKKSKSFP